MPKSERRRTVLSALATGIIAGLPAGLALASPATESGASADAELIRLGGEHRWRAQRLAELNFRHVDLLGDLPPDDAAEIRRLVPETHALAEQIARTRATTLGGLCAKAEALASYIDYDAAGQPMWENHDDLLTWSIVRDLLGDAAAKPKYF